jgi:hypothetical protein
MKWVSFKIENEMLWAALGHTLIKGQGGGIPRYQHGMSTRPTCDGLARLIYRRPCEARAAVGRHASICVVLR